MSKMDDLRAMREARYNRANPRAKSRVPATPAEELCGHRNMSGRTCTREKDHSAKNHRYTERS